MKYRPPLWLFALICGIGWLVTCQAAEPPKPSNTGAQAEIQTFEQLALEGARRSKYLGGLQRSTASEAPAANLPTFKQAVQPILEQACVHCHGPENEEGNIRIDRLDPDLLHGQDADWWLEILAVLTNGEMPPPDETGLTEEQRSQVVDWLSTEVQLASTVRRSSGQHSSFRRMTRYEFNYALQDILGLPWDFAKDLPPEAHSEDGFQNSSEMLHMSVMQFETYQQLARSALQRATVLGNADGSIAGPPPVIHWGIAMRDAAAREWPAQTAQLEEVKKKFNEDPVKQKQELAQLTASFTKSHPRTHYRELSTGRTAVANWFYGGAKYAFEPTDSRQEMPKSFDHVAVIPPGRNQKLTVELGDQIPEEGIMRVRVRASRASNEQTRTPSLQIEFGWQASNEGRSEVRVSSEDLPIVASPDDPQIYSWDIPLGEIYPRNSVRNVSKMGDLPSPSEYIRFVNSSVPQGGEGAIQIDYVEVMAPVYDHWPPLSHQRIFIASENKNDELKYAHDVLTAFMSRAWRRGLTGKEVDQKIRLYEAIRGQCGSFEEAMLEVLATVLSSPKFLYIGDETDARVTGANESPENRGGQFLSANALATRLSMFLWSSVPDAELLELASNGQLLDSTVLSSQVDRMLEDPRAERFSRHFVHQWLNMQLLDFLNTEQNASYFAPLLKEAMHHEPVSLFQEMLRNNESVLNFIHADYTMANERLARHYGIPNVAGNHFRRVELDSNRRRGGLLTQAGLLAMNSDGTDSHPLKRGVWLLERILNDPPPPPPPAVPEIDLADPEIAKLTLKQRIEDHRNHAACMSCHAKIDPWGIAFENYDAMGAWRDTINGTPVDATSRLFNKQELEGMDGLKRFLLLNRQDQFVRALVHKMTTYATGRPLTFGDYTRIDNVTAEVRQRGDGLATMIQQVVASELFRSP